MRKKPTKKQIGIEPKTSAKVKREFAEGLRTGKLTPTQIRSLAGSVGAHLSLEKSLAQNDQLRGRQNGNEL